MILFHNKDTEENTPVPVSVLFCMRGFVESMCFYYSSFIRSSAYSSTAEEAEGAGNAQRWLLCLMLSEGLITPKEADEAVSLISEFNHDLFNRYTEEYGRMRYGSYDFAWTSASVATNEYDGQCRTIKRPKSVYPDG